MNKKYLSIGIVVLLLIMSVSGWLMFNNQKSSDAEMSTNEILNEVTFTSFETNESATVSFTNETALLNFKEFSQVALSATRAASGARYENLDRGLVLWNKGDEITISLNDEEIFVGKAQSANGVQSSDIINKDVSILQKHQWLWKETIMNNDTVIKPKQAAAFTLTFDTEGRVSGTTDCNGFGGSYSVSADGTLTMSQFMMTQMFCEDSQEMEFQNMLTEPLTFMLSETGELVLMLPYDSGSVIFEPKI